MRTIIFLISAQIILPAPAQAFCFQGIDLQGTLDYLVCLHNEQTDTLNKHARTINDQSTELMRQERLIDDLQRRNEALEYDLSTLRDDLEEQQDRVEDLESEVERLRRAN